MPDPLHELATLETFFQTVPPLSEPVTLYSGLRVTNLKEFVAVHAKAIRRGEKGSGEYMMRLQELRNKIKYPTVKTKRT